MKFFSNLCREEQRHLESNGVVEGVNNNGKTNSRRREKRNDIDTYMLWVRM